MTRNDAFSAASACPPLASASDEARSSDPNRRAQRGGSETPRVAAGRPGAAAHRAEHETQQ